MTAVPQEPMPDINRYTALADFCKDAVAYFGSSLSDIEIQANERVYFRTKNGPTTSEYVTLQSTLDSYLDAMPDPARTNFERDSDAEARLEIIDNACPVRYIRVHLWRANGPIITLRLQPRQPPDYSKLGAPQQIIDILKNERQGVIWFTGPPRSGKTWSMHGAVEKLNQEGPPRKIIVVGDPPEFEHLSHTCNIKNREIGFDTPSYHSAIRGALRVNPEILVASEIRGDIETTRALLEMVQLACFTLAGIHVATIYQMVNRILAPFEAAERKEIIEVLKTNTKAIINQRILPGKNGGEVLATEFCRISQANQSLFDKPDQLRGMMQGKLDQDMWLLEDDLSRLVQEELITRDVARHFANDVKYLTI